MAKMMGILPENTYELVDPSFDQMEEFIGLLKNRIVALASPLKSNTGILGSGLLI